MAYPKSILIVGRFNIVRSPMAAAILKKILSDTPGLSSASIDVDSAGIRGAGGFPATRLAREAMKEKGLVLDNHRSKQVYEDMVDYNDLIITITGEDKSDVLAKFPSGKSKVFSLNEYAGGPGDPGNPQGSSSVDAYRDTANQVETLLKGLVQKLQKEG
ncbi:MAG: low molecular weight protein arginine phosphatase [Dehalococcoidia bacterium]|nr:low molecular weight protein arginine phosphatase [Dehalococcoidia bacterium]MDZ4245733.1 low molecular weight protein arginine phosphatase [Dehalococcoidia bacterium]